MPTSGLWQTNLPLLPALLLTTTLFGQTANPHQSSPKSPTSESVEVQLRKCYEALKQDRYDDAEGLALLYKKLGREGEAQKAFSRTKEQRNQSNKLSQLKWDCAHELDRSDCEQTITVCEEHDNPDDEEMLATLEAASLMPATPEPHQQMLSIYTRAGRADLAKAEQQKLHQLVKSSKN